jgi:hypothetical protein
MNWASVKIVGSTVKGTFVEYYPTRLSNWFGQTLANYFRLQRQRNP